MASFALIDRYAGTRLGADLTALPPDQTCAVESSRRLTAEPSYGYIHGLWWLWLADGRSVVSVPPGAGHAVRSVLGSADSESALFDECLAERLKGPVATALLDAGLPATDRVLYDEVFACNGALLKPHPRPDCCRLREASNPAAEGLRLPTHCFPDGVVFGVVQEDQVVSVAFAHRRVSWKPGSPTSAWRRRLATGDEGMLRRR